MTDCRFTPDQIDQMTMWDVEAYSTFREDHPSTDALAAAYLGVKPKDNADAEPRGMDFGPEYRAAKAMHERKKGSKNGR
jgi:hypothetical protein